MASQPDVEHPFPSIEASLKKAVAALREAEVSFLLAGSLAVWARAAPRLAMTSTSWSRRRT